MDGGNRTVLAVVGRDRHATREFLDLLVRCLRDGDTVLLAGRRPAPADARSWRTVEHGKLVRCPRVPAWHPVVVVVDERAVPVGPWLSALERALADPLLGAVAARTNISSGDELLIGVPYRPYEAPVHRSFVRERSNRSEVTEVSCITGPSLALRHRDLEAVGGLGALADPEPIAELARRIAERGLLLGVAEGAYLHTAGGPGPRSTCSIGPQPAQRPGAPLVSACLIVKDEQANLPRCLRSLEGFADEVVVYDTGSSDGTPDLARELGATVFEGYWDADFARARNAALEHCSGQWILWIDADEALVCADRDAARRKLAEAPATSEALVVMVDNLRGTEATTPMAHPASRLFRRAYAHWDGRLHEQVVPRAGTRELHGALTDEVRLTHWGYLHDAIEGRGKQARNLRSAFSDVAGDSEVRWEPRLVNLARSYGFAGRHEEAVDLCRAALAGAPKPRVRRAALRTLVDNLLCLGEAEEALIEIGALREASSPHGAADLRMGQALLALERPAEALAVFERISFGRDEEGFELRPQDVAPDRAMALFRLERYDEASDVLLECIRDAGGMDLPLQVLIAALERSGRSMAEVAASVPEARALAFLGQLVHLPPEDADRALEAWAQHDLSLALLATARTVALGLDVHRQLVWSTRLRQRGLARACPLIGAVAIPNRPVVTRLLGAALAAHLWHDPRGLQAVAALAPTLDPDTRCAAREQVAAVAPSVVALLDGLPSIPVGRPAPVAPTPAPDIGRRVLVVDREPASMRTAALAVGSWRAGNQVTVAIPTHPASSGSLFEHAGVAVRRWPVEPHAEGTWRRACAAAVAVAYAAEPFDAVVLAPSVAAARDKVEGLVACAAVVADADAAEPDDASVHAAVRDLFGPQSQVPWALRTGVVVVGDFATAGDAAIERFEQVVAPLLRQSLDSIPVAVVGSDPGSRIAASLPGALGVGALDNPLPWLGAARGVLVATDAGRQHWLAAAELAGTPVRCVPPEGTDPAPGWRAAVEEACTSLAALADPGAPVPAELCGASTRPSDVREDLGDSCAPPADRLAAFLATTPSPCRRATTAQVPSVPIEVRRGIPPDLSPRRAARCVVELHWGYATIPVEWMGPLRDVADEIWVPGTWGASVLEAAGVRSGAIRIVPPAVDTDLYAPEREPRALSTDKGVRFLFVGDCDDASGIDALLEAYYFAFGSDDDVCLVVHPTGEVRARTFEPDIRRAAAGARGRPAVELVDEPLDADGLAGLYRACDVLVHPQRAAGSPAVILAAMASGRPVVTLESGVGADVCSDRTGWLVPCRTVATDAPGWLVASRGLHQLEPSRAGLADVLRDAAASPDLRLRKGLAARQHVVYSYSLDVAVATAAASEASPDVDRPEWPEAPASPVGAATHRGDAVLAVR